MRTMPMVWGEQQPGSQEPCAACGRELKGKHWYVHVIDGGSRVLHPADEHQYKPDGGEMGSHPIGPECRKKFGEFAVAST